MLKLKEAGCVVSRCMKASARDSQCITPLCRTLQSLNDYSCYYHTKDKVQKRKLKLLQTSGYILKSDLNENKILQWDEWKLQHYVKLLRNVSKTMYISPSLLLHVDENYHPGVCKWSKEIKSRLREFALNSKNAVYDQKVREVATSCSDEVISKISLKSKSDLKKQMKKLDILKSFDYGSNERLLSQVKHTSERKLLNKVTEYKKAEFKYKQRSPDQTGSKYVDDLLKKLTARYSLHMRPTAPHAKRLISTFVELGFKHHEILNVHPELLRVKCPDPLIQCIVEMNNQSGRLCLERDILMKKMASCHPKMITKKVHTVRLARELGVEYDVLEERRPLLKSSFLPDIINNAKFLINKGFSLSELVNCLLSANFHTELLENVFQKIQENNTGYDMNSQCDRISFLYDLHKELRSLSSNVNKESANKELVLENSEDSLQHLTEGSELSSEFVVNLTDEDDHITKNDFEVHNDYIKIALDEAEKEEVRQMSYYMSTLTLPYEHIDAKIINITPTPSRAQIRMVSTFTSKGK